MKKSRAAMETYLTGLQTTNFREGDKLIPVLLRAERGTNNQIDFSLLGNIGVYSQATGQNIPLSQVANMRLEWQSSKVLRRDRLKTVTIESYL